MSLCMEAPLTGLRVELFSGTLILGLGLYLNGNNGDWTLAVHISFFFAFNIDRVQLVVLLAVVADKLESLFFFIIRFLSRGDTLFNREKYLHRYHGVHQLLYGQLFPGLLRQFCRISDSVSFSWSTRGAELTACSIGIYTVKFNLGGPLSLFFCCDLSLRFFIAG